MNPFDLRGPEFLVFYAVFGVLVYLAARWLIRSGEPGSVAQDWHLEDPYEIAYLRAGAAEALRVATVALIDRGLLKAEGDRVVAVDGAADLVRRPIEREIVEYFRRPTEAAGMFETLPNREACAGYRDRLAGRGFLIGEASRARRLAITAGAVGALAGVSAIKIVVALGRGRHNVLFLVGLTALFAILVATLGAARRTGAGDALVGTLRSRFASLKARAAQLRPGGLTNETSYLMAAYGLAVLPAADYPYARTLFPKAAASDSSSFSGGCGSSGCGGGGGGCGGGCGGCGG